MSLLMEGEVLQNIKANAKKTKSYFTGKKTTQQLQIYAPQNTSDFVVLAMGKFVLNYAVLRKAFLM